MSDGRSGDASTDGGETPREAVPGESPPLTEPLSGGRTTDESVSTADAVLHGDRASSGVSSAEYEVSQYFPKPDRATEHGYRNLRAEYGRVRAWAKTRPERFRDLQRVLNQAGMGTTFDMYIARCVRYAGIGTGVGLLVGLVLAYLLAAAGTFTGLRSPLAVDGGWVEIIRANKVILAAAVFAAVSAIATGAGTLFGTYYYPWYRVSQRRRNIDFLLPHAIVYMYALSYGGMNLVEVVDRLADSEDAYDEVAVEFDAIRRDVELFGNDLMSALRNRRNLTPSSSLERFLDDLVSVLDTGGDVTAFLDSSTENYLEEAQEEQEDFLNTIAVFSEVYIAAFVAAPLFLVVIMIVISFLGGSTLGQMTLLIYVVFPAGMALFLVFLSILSAAYTYSTPSLSVEDLTIGEDVTATALADDERFKRYTEGQQWSRLGELLRRPGETIRAEPMWSLAVTVPVAVAFLGAAVALGLASPGALRTDPVNTTTVLAVYPFLILAVPLALFHELKRGRERAIAERFPSALNVLSSANKMGIAFPDALALLSRYTSGSLSEEFRVTRNDLLWSGDLNRSLLRMGNRLRVPQLSRTVKLVADGVRSSGDLARVLSIAAKDTRARERIARARSREMSTYLMVVVIGFLVYLMVIAFLDTGYLAPLEDVAAESGEDLRGSPISLTEIPTDTYRMLLFHSVLIQAVGAGCIAGKLADNSVRSGLKYSIGLVAVTLITFALIT